MHPPGPKRTSSDARLVLELPCALSACSSHLSHHKGCPLISAAPKSRRLLPEFSAAHLAWRERPERRDRSRRNSQALCSPIKRRPVPLPNAYPGGNRSCIVGQAVSRSAKSSLDLAAGLEFRLSDTGDNAMTQRSRAGLPLSALGRLDADRLLQRQEAVLLASTLDHE